MRSSSTPSAIPYPCGLHYSTDSGLLPGPTSSEDSLPIDGLSYDTLKTKMRELDSNRRASSRNNTRRSMSLEKVSFDGEKDELRPIKSTFPSYKQSGIRQNMSRSSQLKTEHILTTKTNITLQGLSSPIRDSDELIAMGKIWSPNVQQRSLGISSIAKSFASSCITNGAQPRKGPCPPSLRSGFSQTSTFKAKEIEPKYIDPMIGATSTFQNRILELSALESETIRWERTKKVKKRSKQDRDS